MGQAEQCVPPPKQQARGIDNMPKKLSEGLGLAQLCTNAVFTVLSADVPVCAIRLPEFQAANLTATVLHGELPTTRSQVAVLGANYSAICYM